MPINRTSGGEERLGRIFKMGDRYLRRLLVTGMTARLNRMKANPDRVDPWAMSLRESNSRRVATVAMAGRTRSQSLAIRRHDETWFGFKPYLAATSFTVPPGSKISATIRAFETSGYYHLPSDEKITPSSVRNSLVLFTEKLTSKITPRWNLRSAEGLVGDRHPPLTKSSTMPPFKAGGTMISGR